MYLYKVFKSNNEVAFTFKGEYFDCFEILWILQSNKDYISCSREKIKFSSNQLVFF